MHKNEDHSSQSKTDNKMSLYKMAVRVLVTIVLLILLAKSVDFSELTTLLFEEINYDWLILASALLIGIRLLMALRWQYLLSSHDMRISFGEIVQVIFFSQFVGQLLPGATGTDVVRGYELAKKHGKVANITTTVILDRFIGAYSIFFLASIGGLLLEVMTESSGLFIQLLVLQIVFIVGWFLLYRTVRIIGAIQVFNNHPTLRNTWSKFLQLLQAITDVEALRSVFLKMMFISVTVQVARCALFYCLYRTLGEAANFEYYLVFVPLTFVMSILPISIGGLGVREGTLVYLFGTVGVAAEVSVGAGLLLYILHFIFSFPTVIVWILDKRPDKISFSLPSSTTEATSEEIGLGENI